MQFDNFEINELAQKILPFKVEISDEIFNLNCIYEYVAAYFRDLEYIEQVYADTQAEIDRTYLGDIYFLRQMFEKNEAKFKLHMEALRNVSSIDEMAQKAQEFEVFIEDAFKDTTIKTDFLEGSSDFGIYVERLRGHQHKLRELNSIKSHNKEQR